MSAPVDAVVMTPELVQATKDVIRQSDFDRWYWYSYGEKCYAFAVDVCVPYDEDVSDERTPEAGSRLWFDGEGNLVGKNAGGEIIRMMHFESIAAIERQNGDAICKFIAESHAALTAAVRSS